MRSYDAKNVGSDGFVHGRADWRPMDLSAANANWEARALCRQWDPETFFPEKTQGRPSATSGYALGVAVAKSVCRSCPVRQECDVAALERGESHGVWGGEVRD